MARESLDSGGNVTRRGNSVLNAPTRVLLLATLLLAFGVRCVGLDAQELRGDEAFGYFFSLASPTEIISATLSLGEPHPVASYWLQHAWLMVAGEGEYALRFPGVWWSVLAVALLVSLAAHVGLNPLAQVATALLMALSPYAIWHAQDARMYNQSLALTLASTLLAVAWWQTDRPHAQHWRGIGYLLVTWLALHTHYFAVYVVFAQHVALLGMAVINGQWRKVAQWIGLGSVLLLLWLPWLWAARAILLDYHGNGDSPGLLDAMVRAHGAFVVGESLPTFWRVWAAGVALGAVALGAWHMARQRRHDARWVVLLGLYWLIPLASTWLSAQSRPIFNERYLVAAVPPVYLLMGAAVGGLHSSKFAAWLGRGVVAAVALAMVLGMVYQTQDASFSKTRGWRELARTLEQLTWGIAPETVRLAQNYPDPTLWYYYRGPVDHLVLPPAANDISQAAWEVEQLVAGDVRRVVLVEQPVAAWDADGVAHSALARAYVPAMTEQVGRWPVSVWLREPDALGEAAVEFDGGLELQGIHIVPTEVPAGGVVEVYLQWQGLAQMVGAQEAVSVQVIDAAGQLVAQMDRALEMTSTTTAPIATYAILLPSSLPVGEHQLVAVVYDPLQAGSPRRLTVDGADHIVFGTLMVLDAPNSGPNRSR